MFRAASLPISTILSAILIPVAFLICLLVCVVAIVLMLRKKCAAKTVMEKQIEMQSSKCQEATGKLSYRDGVGIQ